MNFSRICLTGKTDHVSTKEPTVIRTRTIWIMAAIWTFGNVLSFLVGWGDLRGTIAGSANVLCFSAVLSLVSNTP
jgi:membrane associated rhomboid family serine protease